MSSAHFIYTNILNAPIGTILKYTIGNPIIYVYIQKIEDDLWCSRTSDDEPSIDGDEILGDIMEMMDDQSVIQTAQFELMSLSDASFIRAVDNKCFADLRL
jgi:hypothetical protein